MCLCVCACVCVCERVISARLRRVHQESYSLEYISSSYRLCRPPRAPITQHVTTQAGGRLQEWNLLFTRYTQTKRVTAASPSDSRRRHADFHKQPQEDMDRNFREQILSTTHNHTHTNTHTVAVAMRQPGNN